MSGEGISVDNIGLGPTLWWECEECAFLNTPSEPAYECAACKASRVTCGLGRLGDVFFETKLRLAMKMLRVQELEEEAALRTEVVGSLERQNAMLADEVKFLRAAEQRKAEEIPPLRARAERFDRDNMRLKRQADEACAQAERLRQAYSRYLGEHSRLVYRAHRLEQNLEELRMHLHQAGMPDEAVRARALSYLKAEAQSYQQRIEQGAGGVVGP